MRIKNWLTVAAAMLVLQVFAGVVMSKQTLLVIEPSKEQPRNSEGDIIELKDGRLLLVYSRFTGGGGDHSAADLAMRISGDGGETWSEDKIIVPNKSGKNVMSVSLLRLQNGKIAMFYLPKESLTDCRPVIRISDDEAKTWSEPVECITDQIGYYVMNNDRAVQLSSGRLVLPVALHNQPDWEKPDWAGTVMCYLSDDKGKSWRRSKDTFKGQSPEGKRVTLQEPGVVELKDGSIMMFIRTSGGSQYICYSKDGAETWSKPKPSSLASPISPATIKRIPWNGNLLCVWNDHSGLHPYPKGKRTPLCSTISSDGGKTWSKSKVIESDPDGWYCYMSMTFVEGRLVLSYCAGDKKVGGLNRLKITSLSSEWLESDSQDKDKLRKRAVTTLRKSLRDGKEFVKVHAAEELIWAGYPQKVKELYLTELEKDPGPSSRVGVWRVLAFAADNESKRQEYIDKLVKVFLNPDSPDRGSAGETLGKLGYSEHRKEVIDMAADSAGDKQNLRWAARWIMANSTKPKDEKYLAELLDDKNAQTRRITAYSLRWQKKLQPETLDKLKKLADEEKENPVYFLSASCKHLPNSELAYIKKKLLWYAENGDVAQKCEACAGLCYVGGLEDIELLEKLMADESLDVRSNAAYAILEILTPYNSPLMFFNGDLALQESSLMV